MKAQTEFLSSIFVTSISGHLKSTDCCFNAFQNDMWQEIIIVNLTGEGSYAFWHTCLKMASDGNIFWDLVAGGAS